MYRITMKIRTIQQNSAIEAQYFAGVRRWSQIKGELPPIREVDDDSTCHAWGCCFMSADSDEMRIVSQNWDSS